MSDTVHRRSRLQRLARSTLNKSASQLRSSIKPHIENGYDEQSKESSNEPPWPVRANVQFRVESFNISNTPNFYIGNRSSGASFGNTAFGSVSQTDPTYTPRQYQFALKWQF